MPRKKPLCALCGEPIVGTASITHEFMGLPYKPFIGWHWDCRENDSLAKQLNQKDSNVSVESILNEIDRRGAGRVVKNKKP